jgi:hypothetical protein
MAAFTAAVTGLATTGQNVVRDRPYDQVAPCALSIFLGPDTPIGDDDKVYQFIDSYLTIYVDVRVKQSSLIPVTITLNQIRKEIVVAINPEPPNPFGLTFCHWIAEGIAGDPDYDVGDQPTASQRLEWIVKYRRSQSDPSA